MRGSPESGLPNSFRRLLFLAPFLILFCSLPAIAQKAQGNDASAPKYDLHTETKLKATVEDVKLPRREATRRLPTCWEKNGTEIVDVYLCPKSFLEGNGRELQQG